MTNRPMNHGTLPPGINSGGRSRREEFVAYDSLPAPIRQALREANFNWCSVAKFYLWRKGASMEEIIGWTLIHDREASAAIQAYYEGKTDE